MQNFHKTNAHDLYDENLSVLLITSKQSFFYAVILWNSKWINSSQCNVQYVAHC